MRLSRFAVMLLVLTVFSALVVVAQETVSPVEKLMEGNARYVSGRLVKKDMNNAYRQELAKGQTPYAVIVACADSCVSPEIIFDEDLGKLFVVRTAGNVVDPIVIGSIEYAVEYFHTPLIIVMGHESCGAVKAAISSPGGREGNIGTILKKIGPAVKKAKEITKEEKNLAYQATIKNVENVAKEIKSGSKIVSHLIKEGKLMIVGGYYSIATGKVDMVSLN